MKHFRNITLLCEGSSDELFLRRFFAKHGVDKRAIIPVNYLRTSGSGEQYVRNHYPLELRRIRLKQNSGLVVMLDADTKNVEERKKELDEACRERNVPARSKMDPVLIVVPKRNSETWYKFLTGETASEDEEKEWKKSNNHVLAKTAANALYEICFIKQNLPESAPPSLKEACVEWHVFNKLGA